jgi:hypothetical protein
VTENRKRSVARNVVRAFVAIWLLAVIGLYIQWHRNQVRRGPVAQQITCINNLKQVGLAFRQWALDYGDRFPFNVSTNEGGTLELCAPDKDGFDASAARHFQVMSNELNTPRILVCPKDKGRKPAKEFASLLPANVTYRVRSGTNVSDTHPREILVVCPVDGNTVYCDGRVVEGKNIKR